MPAYKYSMTFKYISGAATAGWKNIPGGWSESVFFGSITDADLTRFRSLAESRASLLPNYCAITGLRRQQVDPNLSANTIRVNYAGPSQAAFKQDIPQMGLLMSIPAVGLPNVRRHRIAALPDDRVTRGEFNPDTDYKMLLNIYLTRLATWQMRGADLSQPIVDIKTIDASGAYVLASALALAEGNVVNVRSTVKANGQKFSQQCVVIAPVTGTTGVLRNWQGGACTLGKMRKFVPVYPLMNTTGLTPDMMDIIVRKIGRPTRRYVGRQRRRRR